VSHFIYHYAECRYAECHYAEFRYAECHYAECRSALACFAAASVTKKKVFNDIITNPVRQGNSASAASGKLMC
jgi:hypothetical protein